MIDSITMAHIQPYGTARMKNVDIPASNTVTKIVVTDAIRSRRAALNSMREYMLLALIVNRSRSDRLFLIRGFDYGATRNATEDEDF